MSMQRGAGTLLLMAVLVPVLFYGTTVMLSLYKVNTRRGDLQSNLEQALMKGARYLPDTREALRVTKQDLQSKFGEELRIVEKHKSSYSIAVSLQHPTQRKLAIPLVKSEREIRVSESAQARITAQPKDVYIFFENSSYLAPPISSIETDDAFYWGQSVKRNTVDGKWDRRDDFGYFDTFMGVTKAKLLDYNTRGGYGFSSGQNGLRSLMSIISPHWQAADLFKEPALRPGRLRSALRTNDAITQAVFTQACFNPILSALKLASVRLYDNFSSLPLNQISVESGPITGAPPNLNRLGIASNAGEAFTIQEMSAGGDPLRTGQANLENNRGEKISLNQNIEANHRLRVRDQECWSAFEIATRRWLITQHQSFLGSGEKGSTIYSIPKVPSYFTNVGLGGVGANIPAPILRETRYGSGRFHYELNRGSINNLRTREAIWARSVAEDYDGELRTSDDTIRFDKIVTGIIRKLVNTFTPPNLLNLRKIAGTNTEKRAFILLGDTPHLNLGGQALYNLRSAKNRNLTDQYLSALNNQLSRLREAMRNKPGRLRVFVVIPRHEGSYSQQVCTSGGTLPGELVCQPFRKDMAMLRDEISTHTKNWSNVDVTTIPATDVGTLTLDLLSSLISSGQNYVLSDV